VSKSDLEASSREAIRKGSRSFAAAAALFDRPTRADAEGLYAWCRHCDDVIDGQVLGHGMTRQDPDAARARLEALKTRTRSALAGTPTDDPAFAAFQWVAQRRNIPEAWALALLDGFAMDVDGRLYRTLDETLDYCWHVAGVVGVMMAVVMGVAPDDLATLRRAQDLGLAFQLTNIARDVIEDAQCGRVYLPIDWLEAAGVDPREVAEPRHREAVAASACLLLAAAEPYYDSAAAGLGALPFRSAWAIAAARGVYRRIGVEVAARGVRAWDSRVSVSGPMKAALAIQGGGLALASRLRREAPVRPASLWSKL